MKRFQAPVKFFAHRYRLSVLLFALWSLFIADVDVFRMVETRHELNVMKDKIAFHQAEIADLNHKLDDIASNRSHLERYAREAYYMCKSNEEVFLME
jgi:cell division protein DivIC